MIKAKLFHVGEWLGLHPWVKCEGRKLFILLWPLKWSKLSVKCKVFMFCVSILILYPGSLCYVMLHVGQEFWLLLGRNMIDIVYPFLCHKKVYIFLVKYFVLFSLHELGTEQTLSSRNTHRKKSKEF
jgi:hypothetical protein